MVCLWPYNLETTLNGIRTSGVLTIADSKDIGLELKNKEFHAYDCKKYQHFTTMNAPGV